MADALRQQMADDIASLVRKQTFAGSGVWRQSGNATLRIETQTDSIVEALKRIPSQETQDEEERESDRQHEELIDAIEGDGSSGDSGEDSKKLKGIFKEYKPSTVIHLAGQAGVRFSMEDPKSYVDSNIIGSFNFNE